MKKLSILAIALVVFQSCIKVKSGEGAVISFTDVKEQVLLQIKPIPGILIL
jgi:hypothetical protein